MGLGREKSNPNHRCQVEGWKVQELLALRLWKVIKRVRQRRHGKTDDGLRGER